MKLLTITFLLWIFTVAACHRSARQDTAKGYISSHFEQIDSGFLAAWSSFVALAKSKNWQQLKRVSMDSIQACDSVYSISRFPEQCFTEVFDSTLLAKIGDSNAIEFTGNGEFKSSFSLALQKLAIPTSDDAITLKEVVITKADGVDSQWIVVFDFFPTRKGYMFYRCNSVGGPVCCN